MRQVQRALCDALVGELGQRALALPSRFGLVGVGAEVSLQEKESRREELEGRRALRRARERCSLPQTMAFRVRTLSSAVSTVSTVSTASSVVFAKRELGSMGFWAMAHIVKAQLRA